MLVIVAVIDDHGSTTLGYPAVVKIDLVVDSDRFWFCHGSMLRCGSFRNIHEARNLPFRQGKSVNEMQKMLSIIGHKIPPRLGE
jgi:hypothetical protein